MDESTEVVFTDSVGREWRPHITARVIRDFEQRTGIGLFSTVFDVFIDPAKEPEKAEAEVTPTIALSVAKKLFGSVGDLVFLLYESCRGLDGLIIAKTPGKDGEPPQFGEVSFDDFCGAVGPEEINLALRAAVMALFSFFPELTKGEEKEAAASGPFARGTGS